MTDTLQIIEFYATSAFPVTSDTITVTYANGDTGYIFVEAFGVNGTNIVAPFDTEKSLPATNASFTSGMVNLPTAVVNTASTNSMLLAFWGGNNSSSGFVEVGSGAVDSVKNTDGSLTANPVVGDVVVSLNTNHANTWQVEQVFVASGISMSANGSTGVTTLANANTSTSSYTITLPAATGTVALTSGANVASVANTDGSLTVSPTTGSVVASLDVAHANTWTAVQTISLSGVNPPTMLVLNSDPIGSAIEPFISIGFSGGISYTFKAFNNTATLGLGGIYDGSGNTILHFEAGGTVGRLDTYNNILDNGSGNMTLYGTLALDNPTHTFAYTLTPAAITASYVLNLPLITATDTLAVLGTVQTFTATQTFGGTTAPEIKNGGNGLLIYESTNTNSVRITTSAFTASYNIALPLVTANDTFAVLGLAQTFTALVTFSAGVTGTGNTGTLTAGTGILGTANAWTGVQTFGNNISIGGATLNVATLASTDILQYNGTNWVNVTAVSIAPVSSVSNSDGTLTISPTTGAVVASLNTANANAWTGLQTFKGGTYAIEFSNVAGQSSQIHFDAAGSNQAWNITNNASAISTNEWYFGTGGSSLEFVYYNSSAVLVNSVTFTAAGALTSFKNTLDDGSGNMSVKGKITSYNGITTAGFGVPAVVAAASETELTATTATVIATHTPAATGIFLVNLYFRVVTATTTVTATATWDDTTGAQTYNWLSSVSEPVGSYVTAQLFVSATSAAAIAVTVTAGTANQVYATAGITQLA